MPGKVWIAALGGLGDGRGGGRDGRCRTRHEQRGRRHHRYDAAEMPCPVGCPDASRHERAILRRVGAALMSAWRTPTGLSERVRGIEPPFQAWEACVLPLNHT